MLSLSESYELRFSRSELQVESCRLRVAPWRWSTSGQELVQKKPATCLQGAQNWLGEGRKPPRNGPQEVQKRATKRVSRNLSKRAVAAPYENSLWRYKFQGFFDRCPLGSWGNRHPFLGPFWALPGVFGYMYMFNI